MSGRLSWLRERGMGASILVATITATFGVLLVEATAYIGLMLRADPFIGDSETLAFVTSILTVLLTAVAMYVAAIVTANTFSTVIAGRARQIALLRVIGATARSERERVARQGFIVGLIGAALGLALGLGGSALGVLAAERLLGGAPENAVVGHAGVLLPLMGVILTTGVAAHIGSRRVLTVTPLEAIGGAVERSRAETVRGRGRHIGVSLLLACGVALLVLGVLAGLVTPLGIVVAFVGGILSFTAIALGATVIMPPLLRLVGRALGKSATARMAAENALRYPERSSRMAIGVVMGVTLVTMFAVALESVKALIVAASGGVLEPQMAFILDSFGTVMMVLVGVCAVIAGVGLVNLLTVGIVQRRRELGLLRAVGLSNRQLRLLVLLEATHLIVTATLTGLALGVVYGWIAAQSLLGSVTIYQEVGPPGLVIPHIPAGPLLVITAASALLTLVATIAPTRLATRVTPVEALAAV